MKKIAKILALFSLVAALVGVFALVTSADVAEPVAFAPASGTTFAVWESEEAYIRGDAPQEHTAKNLDTWIGNYKDDPKTAIERRTAYIKLYADVSVGNYNVYYLDFIVDCNQYKFTVGALDLRFSDMTVMNGTLEHTKQLDIQQDSEVLYKNLTHNVVYNANTTGKEAFINFAYLGSTENSLTWDNCVINWKYSTDYIRAVGPVTNKGYAEIKFIDTDIIVSGNCENLVRITEFAHVNGYDAKVKVLFDGKSSVQGNVASYVLLTENFMSNQISGFTDNPQYVFFEEGFTCSANAIPDLKYGIKKYTASGELQDVQYVDGSDGPDCKVWFVAQGSETPLAGQFYAILNEQGLYELRTQASSDMIWYTYVGTPGAFIAGTPAVNYVNGYPSVTVADVRKIPTGATVVLLQDIYVTGGEVINYSNDLVFDLNKHTMYMEARWRASSMVNGSYLVFNLTMKNGKIDASVRSDYFLDGLSNGGTVTLQDLEIIGGATCNNAIKRNDGTLVVKNCTVTAYNVAFTFTESQDITLDFENVTINAKTAINTRVYPNKTSDISFKNCTVNATDKAFSVENVNNPTDDDMVYITVDGCYITANYQVYNYHNGNSRPAETVVLNASNTYFSRSLRDTDNFTLNVAKGERVMPISGVSGFALYVGKVPLGASALQANLTLYTDFDLNFYADPSVITAIYYNGAPLASTFENDYNVYTVSDITPDTAAEDLSFTVYATVNGVTYQIPLAYSVLKYAESVVSSGSGVSEVGKQLVSTAMAYVQAAYEYKGKDAPSFTGVEYTDATAPKTNSITMPAAIKGVQLELDSDFKLRFNLTPGANALLGVNGCTYEVSDGLVGGIAYITVELRAYAFYDAAIRISDGSTSGNYSLAHYVNYVNGLEGYETLKELVNSLYTFTYYADLYRTSGIAN